MNVLFQITDSEIKESAGLGFNAGGVEFDSENTHSFLYVSIVLRGKKYPRYRYAEFTREVNKRINHIPVVVIFRDADNLVSIGFVHRRKNKKNSKRQVLGRVFLVREICPQNPHRVHQEILYDLSLQKRLEWIEAQKKPLNFDGLLAGWLDALDTEKLNKRFYKDLFAWFERAVEECRFPDSDFGKTQIEFQIIRLITRLLFIWFLKEKELVPGNLFVEEQIKSILNNYSRDDGDSYYRAVLQNLFFETLNTEIDYRDFSFCEDDISDEQGILKLFGQVPFVNGGLFDRLDGEINAGNGNCSIPNRLFFGRGAIEKQGLIDLFSHYKFTVEENTPIEQEVALDPELLGKVFENLLAAYNPETRQTVRHETGSYYTPRAVVDYMVNEALVAALSERVQPSDSDKAWFQERLRYLLDYSDAFDDADELFTRTERKAILRIISRIRILDPAVGSGAFPMSMLHKLTLVLRRLDERNNFWGKLGHSRAFVLFDMSDQEDFDEASVMYGSDFRRKLYIIQNSIFGVDVQPVAIQIAKLRFFISLTIEQRRDSEAENFGIRPLPNLETRFVAADTLLRLSSSRAELASPRTRELQEQLRRNRESYFHANNSRSKHQRRKTDCELRKELSNELKRVGMGDAAAAKIAKWDPYDQNTRADWFDAKYMFGVSDGFDVVIGNPPYIEIANLPAEMRKYLLENYENCEKRTDIYIAFVEKALSSLRNNGVICFILPFSFAVQQYATKIRQKLISNHHIRELVDASSYSIFENATVKNVVLTVVRNRSTLPTGIRLHRGNADFENRSGTEFSVDQESFAGLKDSRLDTNPEIQNALRVKEKCWLNSVRLDEICLVAYGARLNHRCGASIYKKNHYVSTTKTSGSRKFCEGKNIERYIFSQWGWLNYTPDEHYNPMFPELFENEKLMCINVVKDRLRVAYDNQGFYNSNTIVNCVRLDLLSKATHRTAVKAVKENDVTFAREFDYKFLLAILNSKFINWYFLSFLSEGLHFYPDDAKQLRL